MPVGLHQEVKDDIPKHIGFHAGDFVIKNPKKQKLGIDENILKDSLIRSLYREYEKFRKTCDIKYTNKMQKRINRLKNEAKVSNNNVIKYRNAIHSICDKYGLNYREVKKMI